MIMVTRELIIKTRQYLDYLDEHINCVDKAFHIVIEKCKDLWFTEEPYLSELKVQIMWHDASKMSGQEFIPYRKKFFTSQFDKNIEEGFKWAWVHHKRNNYHHHETAETDLDVVHMVIDWLAMELAGKDSAEEYWRKNKRNMKLSKEHKAFIEDLLRQIKR